MPTPDAPRSPAPAPTSLTIGARRFDDLLDSIAAKTPTPGGGAVASAVGALAAALAGMVVAYSVGKKNLAAYEPALQDAQRRLRNARALLMTLADEDAEAYGLVNELSKLPESDPRRQREWVPAVRASVAVPLAVQAACADLLRLMQSLATTTNRHLLSDLAIAAILADASGRSARWNVLVNLANLPTDEDRHRALAETDALRGDCAARSAAVEHACTATA